MHVTVNKGLPNKPRARRFSTGILPEGTFGTSPVMSHLSKYLIVKSLAPKTYIYWAEPSYIMFFAEQYLGFATYQFPSRLHLCLQSCWGPGRGSLDTPPPVFSFSSSPPSKPTSTCQSWQSSTA